MLSILIPIYNFDVRGLINELHAQCITANIAFEIICFDDCSNESFKEINATIKELKYVSYTELEENIGRSKIRNSLAKAAKYDFFLFMDCDSLINSKSYISNYISALHPQEIIFGGRGYEKNAPLNKTFLLRWIYGVNRESVNAITRNKTPYRYFMTNNFIVPKAIINQIKFDENIVGYGYEDTLFAQDLKRKNIIINHIDNPLIHIGLETSEEFLSKTRNGMQNLATIISQGKIGTEIKLYRVLLLVGKWKIKPFVLLSWHLFKPHILSNLNSEKPSLKYFDFFKLAHLLLVYKEKNKAS